MMHIDGMARNKQWPNATEEAGRRGDAYRRVRAARLKWGRTRVAR